MPDKINIEWKEFNNLVEKVAILMMQNSNWLLVGIMRGGNIIDILSEF